MSTKNTRVPEKKIERLSDPIYYCF